MKKLLVLTLAIIMLAGVSSVFADGQYTRDPSYRVDIAKHSGTRNVAALSTEIVAGNSILGFTYSDSAAGTGILWDVASVGTRTNTALVGEASVAAGTAETVIFPFPYKVVNGLVTTCSTATGNLFIYYE